MSRKSTRIKQSLNGSRLGLGTTVHQSMSIEYHSTMPSRVSLHIAAARPCSRGSNRLLLPTACITKGSRCRVRPFRQSCAKAFRNNRGCRLSSLLWAGTCPQPRKTIVRPVAQTCDKMERSRSRTDRLSKRDSAFQQWNSPLFETNMLRPRFGLSQSRPEFD